MKNTKAFAVAVLVLALATLACATAGAPATESYSAAATVHVDPTPEPTHSVTPTLEAQPTPVSRSETYGHAGPTSTPTSRSETYGYAGPTSTDINGTWVGITSQSNISQPRLITITIESNTVTSVEIDMVFYGEDWHAEMRRYAPLAVPIKDDQFETKLIYPDTTIVIAGIIYGAELRGAFQAYHTHPQGLGDAIGEGLFIATKQ